MCSPNNWALISGKTLVTIFYLLVLSATKQLNCNQVLFIRETLDCAEAISSKTEQFGLKQKSTWTIIIQEYSWVTV